MLPADQGFLTFEKVLAEGAACLENRIESPQDLTCPLCNLWAVTELLGRFRSRLMVLKFMFMKLVSTMGAGYKMHNYKQS